MEEHYLKEEERKNESKACLKKIKGDLNKWKDIPWSGTGRLNIVKMATPPQMDLQIQHNLYQNPRWFLCKKFTS